MNNKWIWPVREDESEEKLPGYSRIERDVLRSRGIQTLDQAKRFLDHSDLIEGDPFSLKGMAPAVERVIQARENDERVLVYGDYDADGITSTALLVEVFNDLGMQTEFYIPHRVEQGYGLHPSVLERVQTEGFDLVVTVDCGIRALKAIEAANQAGLDVVVTDHHEPGSQLPNALAVINPKQDGDGYGFKGFAGVGLAYKLARGVLQRLDQVEKKPLLDLVALGTVADLAPLGEENRTLVIKGLKQLADTQRLGLIELLRAARQQGRRMSTETIAFGLAPRINAIGRLQDARKAVELLLTNDGSRAFELASELDRVNRRRQSMTADIVDVARLKIEEEDSGEEILFVGDKGFHQGIIGLAASRLSDEYYRPAIVAHTGDEITRASARSIPGFNITGALEACSHVLIRFGGHKAAAGFSLRTEDIGHFRQMINEHAKEEFLTIDLIPSVDIEAEVTLDELTFDLLHFLDKVEPCGVGNPLPIFGARNVQILSSRAVGKDGAHLKLMLKQGGQPFDAIAFNQGQRIRELTPLIDIAFHFERNDYMEVEGRQLNIKAIKSN